MSKQTLEVWDAERQEMVQAPEVSERPLPTAFPTCDAVLADWLGCETADISEFFAMVVWDEEERLKNNT